MSDQFNNAMGESRYRLAILWLFFLGWTLLLFLRLFQVMAVDREEYLLDQETGNNWQYELIPAARGRLLDSSGRALAWSSRHFALDWRVPHVPDKAVDEWSLIQQTVDPDRQLSNARIAGRTGERIRVVEKLTPDEFKNSHPLASGLPSLRIESYFVRQRIRHSRLRELIGKVRIEDGTEIGYTGWEKKHNTLLQGTPAVLRIRLGQDNQPIPGTREVIRDLKEGHDVYLPFNIK